MQGNFLEIKAGLVRAGISQRQLAEDLGVSRVSVYHVMKGFMTSSRIRQHIAEIVGWDPWTTDRADEQRRNAS